MFVDCPGCHLRYHLPDRAPGTRARCRCGTTFALPVEPTTAGSLQCPTCGAASDPKKQSCEYCSAKLAIAACASCFGMMFSGTRHCPHCGVRADLAARPAASMESVRRCPRCANGTHLVGALVAETMLDRCEQCGGTFIDRASVEKLIADRDRQATMHMALSGAGAAELEMPATNTDTVKYLKCPECAQLMARRNFARVSGVIIDVCAAHGTWFDAEELRRIIEFVQAGGLDKMRKQEIDALDKKIEEKKERARAVGSQAMASSYRGFGRRWSAEEDFVSGALEAAVSAIFKLW